MSDDEEAWEDGSILMEEIIHEIKNTIRNEKIRVEIYDRLICIFEDFGCNTLDKCKNIDFAYDQALENPVTIDASTK